MSSKPNRHQRRGAAARNRKKHDTFYEGYIKHLPQIPLDAPFERGRVYHTCFHHDHWCRFYENENLADCTCNVFVTRHVEPVRQ